MVDGLDGYAVFTNGSVSFAMIPVPGYGFSIGETLVTQELWESILGSNPSVFQGTPQLPVEGVSYNECTLFIKSLNEMTGEQFRLPTASEWRIAAWAGTRRTGSQKYAGSNNADEVAWYSKNSQGRTHPVKEKAPNPIGLYDLSGNVFEFTSSHEMVVRSDYTPSVFGPKKEIPLEDTFRFLILGGCYCSDEHDLEIKHDKARSPSTRDRKVGFRLVLDTA